MNAPKTQHYVPQFILRQFLADAAKEQVWVYDKHEDRGFLTSIKNVMAENRFNDFVFEDWIVSFEPIVSKIENICLPAYQRIIKTRHLEGSPREKADLAFLIAFQLLRTKTFRQGFEDLESMIKDKVQAMGGRMEDIRGWEPPTDDTRKRSVLISIRDMLPRFAHIIAGKDYFLAEATPGRHFYLGDSPVCLNNARDFGPYGNLGLALPGIEIYLPLSSTLMLCAWCPSIMEGIRRDYAENRQDIPSSLLSHYTSGRISAPAMKAEMESARELWKPIKALIDAVASGTPVSSGLANMDFYNSLQTGTAYRYVVCLETDVGLARRHNREFPHLRKGRRFTPA